MKSRAVIRMLAAIAVAAWSMVGLGPRNAAAEETRIVLDMPVVVTTALDGQTLAQQIRDANDVTDAGVIAADAATGAGRGEARVGLTDVVKARSRGEGSSGSGEVYMEFTVEDPQNRPEIKTILRFKGVAATRADPPDTNSFKGAQWSVQLGLTDGVPLAIAVLDDLTSLIVSGPGIIGEPVLWAENTALSQAGGLCERFIRMNGVTLTNEWTPGCTNTGLGGTLDLTHAPGRYVMHTKATAGNYGMAVGDPVWEPHPDYPDVVITRHAPSGVPRAPLSDTTPEELQADGIDPTLFIEAGFFTDPTPAQPTSTPVHSATPMPTVTPTPAPVGTKKCDPAGADAATIVAARARIDSDCPCGDYDGSKGKKHRDYVRCATQTVKALLQDALLKKSCKKATRKCAASSTCGSPGSVICQFTTARHGATCAIKSGPARCVAPRGGDAWVVGAATSCCDVGVLREDALRPLSFE